MFTPSQGTSTSPAQQHMSKTKTLLPTKETLLKPQVPDPQEQQRLLRQRQLKKAQYYNRTAKDLPELEIGDVVQMKPITYQVCTWCKATVTQKVDQRLYVVTSTPQ